MGQRQFAAPRTTPMGEFVIHYEDGGVFKMRKKQEDASDKKRRRPLYCAV